MAYADRHLRKLICICRALQVVRGDDSPFPLSARLAGKLLRVNPMRAWRMLRRLVRDGVLERVSVGDPSARGGRASEYRYRGGAGSTDGGDR